MPPRHPIWLAQGLRVLKADPAVALQPVPVVGRSGIHGV